MIYYSLNLWNGIATLTVSLPNYVKIGDELCFTTEVEDITRHEPLRSEFYVKVEREKAKSGAKDGERKSPPSSKEGKDRKKESYLDIPDVKEIRRNDWDKHDFNSNSALKVVDAGEGRGYDFFINMDNGHLQMEIKGNKKIEPKLLEARYKYGMVLLGISIIHQKEEKSKNKTDNSDENEKDKLSIEDKITQFTEATSPILLPMIAALGDLKEE